jgi:hypothetical protein
MLEIHGPDFCHAIMALARVQTIVDAYSGKYKGITAASTQEKLDGNTVKSCAELMEGFATNVGNLGATVTRRAAEDLKARLGENMTLRTSGGSTRISNARSAQRPDAVSACWRRRRCVAMT